jgi:hypothetical protein
MYAAMQTQSGTFKYLAVPIYITMKKEVHNTAHRLLELLYAQDLDRVGLEALTLPHKHDAIALLIEEGLVLEDEILLQTDECYCYYSITLEGEQQFESGNFKPEQKPSRITYIVIIVIAIAVVVGITRFLILYG